MTFYRPVLATFVLTLFSKKISARGMKFGIIISVFINLIFSKTMQGIIGFDPGSVQVLQEKIFSARRLRYYSDFSFSLCILRHPSYAIIIKKDLQNN